MDGSRHRRVCHLYIPWTGRGTAPPGGARAPPALVAGRMSREPFGADRALDEVAAQVVRAAAGIEERARGAEHRKTAQGRLRRGPQGPGRGALRRRAALLAARGARRDVCGQDHHQVARRAPRGISAAGRAVPLGDGSRPRRGVPREYSEGPDRRRGDPRFDRGTPTDRRGGARDAAAGHAAGDAQARGRDPQDRQAPQHRRDRRGLRRAELPPHRQRALHGRRALRAHHRQVVVRREALLGGRRGEDARGDPRRGRAAARAVAAGRGDAADDWRDRTFFVMVPPSVASRGPAAGCRVDIPSGRRPDGRPRRSRTATASTRPSSTATSSPRTSSSRRPRSTAPSRSSTLACRACRSAATRRCTRAWARRTTSRPRSSSATTRSSATRGPSASSRTSSSAATRPSTATTTARSSGA